MSRILCRRLVTILEISFIYLFIQIYIWHWQFSHRGLAWPMILALFASHIWHRDTLDTLGFRLDNFVPALRLCAIASIPFLFILVTIGVMNHQLWNHSIHRPLLSSALRYIIWAIFQQYGLQGVFHRRLKKLTTNPWFSSALCALIFMSLHFPNPALMFFTLLGGFALSWIYLKQPNLLALGTCQGLVGLSLSNCFTPTFLPNMRVGPGFFS